MAAVTLPPHAAQRLGRNVALARGARKRTAIATGIGSSREALAQVERGMRVPSVAWLATLADSLGTTVSALLEGVRLIPDE